eukprot:Awhi_evm1s73
MNFLIWCTAVKEKLELLSQSTQKNGNLRSPFTTVLEFGHWIVVLNNHPGSSTVGTVLQK